MKKQCLTVFYVWLFTLGYAQKAPIKFGDIPMDDMQMKVYTLDSSAAAVILTDYGEARVEFTSVKTSLVFDRHVRIKILKKEGLKWADAAIQLFNSGGTDERVSSLKASTYNLEGGKVVETKMPKESIFREKFNRNINLQKFTLPAV